MSCVDKFEKKPVVIQIKNPIAAVHSSEATECEDEKDLMIGCGRASISMQAVFSSDGKQQFNPATGQPLTQAIPTQVFRGEIVASDEQGLVFQTTGGDNRTQVLIYVPLVDVQAISFALDHPEEDEKPRIIS